MNHSTPGLPVHHQLPEPTQTHIHRQWCHQAILSSVDPFSSCPQSLPASGSLLMSQLFTWGGQRIAVSASASVFPMTTHDWSPLGWTGWISLHYKGLSRVFSNTTDQNHQFFSAQLSSQSNSHIHTRPLEKPCEWVSEVIQSCLTLCDPVDCSLPGSSIHGILQARILEWISISFSSRSFGPRDRTWVSCIIGRCFTVWATREAIALTRWTFVGKVISLLFNMLSRLIINFLPRSKRLLFFFFLGSLALGRKHCEYLIQR